MVTAWRLIHWLELGLMTAADAFAVATATVVAQAFGAGSYERVRLGPRRLLIATLLLVGSCALAACLVAGSLAQRLGLVEGASELAALLAPLTLPFSVLYALVVVIGAAQRGAGLNMRPTVVTVVGCCVAPLLWLVLAVPQLHSIVTVALARPLTWGVTAAIMLVYYRHGRWLTLALRKARKQRNSRPRGRRKRSSDARHRA
jgi:Na+-driven multidrug efflux pump